MTTKANDIFKNFGHCSPKQAYTNLKYLSLAREELKKKLMRIDNIYNMCKNDYSRKYDTWHDDAYNNYESQLIAPSISIPVIKVPSLLDIPNFPIYWVEDIQQFAFKLNNTIFRGNIGNIYNKNHIKKSIENSSNNVRQTQICVYKNKCHKILAGQLCKFYHDPKDLKLLYDANTITKENYQLYLLKHRNFLNTSWILTDMPHNDSNNNMRHFGSRNTLRNDLDLIQFNNSNQDSIDTFKHQCMHDMLVILASQN
jgi:hypothetical protein